MSQYHNVCMIFLVIFVITFSINILGLKAIKGEKGSINASNENVRSETDHTLEENTESNTQPIQFQVASMYNIIEYNAFIFVLNAISI